jgi:hypothetical protein
MLQCLLLTQSGHNRSRLYPYTICSVGAIWEQSVQRRADPEFAAIGFEVAGCSKGEPTRHRDRT